MKRLLVALIGLFALFATPSLAANCSAYPYTLTNGSLADANQVMANFNSILNCGNNNLAKSGANSDITSLTGLTTPLSVSQGGTGLATATNHGVVLGQGTAAMAVTSAGTFGYVLTSAGASTDPSFQQTWPFYVYQSGGQFTTFPHVHQGAFTVGGGGSVGISFGVPYTNSGSYQCVATATGTTPHATSVVKVDGSNATLYGTAGDVVGYICSGQ